MNHHVVLELAVQWGEMDALGHVNNTRFFTWFESARIELARRTGMYDEASLLIPVLVNTACDYLKPVVFPAQVCIGVSVTAVGKSSVSMEYAVWRKGEPEVLHARATSVVVMVDRTTRDKALIPDALRGRLTLLG